MDLHHAEGEHMSIRVQHTLRMQNSRDTDGKDKLFYRDDTLGKVAIDTFDNQMSSSLSVAASTTDSLTFGDLTDVRGFYLEVSGNCNIRFNGATADIPVTLAPGQTVAKVFIEAAITAVTIENTSATTVLTGVYCGWGDPTP